jgi:hypothetical protein
MQGPFVVRVIYPSFERAVEERLVWLTHWAFLWHLLWQSRSRCCSAVHNSLEGACFAKDYELFVTCDMLSRGPNSQLL